MKGFALPRPIKAIQNLKELSFRCFQEGLVMLDKCDDGQLQPMGLQVNYRKQRKDIL
jgi:hypothetical protein